MSESNALHPERVAMTLVLNGHSVSVEVDPRETLFDTLRERLRATGTKGACLGGECGSCTILLDGEPVTACLVMALQADGRAVDTVEGLAEGEQLSALQAAFVQAGAVQCGYCTPGLLVAATALLRKNPKPTEQDVRRGLAGNLCRCTGYGKIIEAVLNASQQGDAQGTQKSALRGKR
ncbi:MAG: (2Fe-2S)-binding protein [Deltaproteobacteria bacterium]|nr:(2Fe-2S)-binding protein [Deltaproteobacteria bacterium]